MFEFNTENIKKADQILKKYPDDQSRSAVMPLLWLTQEQDGQNILNKDKIEYVAKMLNLPEIKVYEVASFYTMYNLKDVGQYHIQVCGTVPCHLVGSKDILSACKNFLGVDRGEITSDGKFSYTEVECLGACSEAPVLQLNNKEYFVNLDKSKLLKLIKSLGDGENAENIQQALEKI
jgi:NADH-quinone oxidoreductase E subunit